MEKLEALRSKNTPSITLEEKNKILTTFNGVAMDYPQDKTVVQLFEEQVNKTPENIAIAFEDEELTYSELNMRANVLAHKLRDLGVVPDDYVVIMAERSLEMIIGIFGIIKAGGAYVPIDPTAPSERAQYMIEDCCPKAVVTYKVELVTSIPVINLDEIGIWEGEVMNPEPLNKPDDLIYCIYTSGTTGRPKGVMIEHRNVLNLVEWHRNYAEYSESTIVIQFLNYIFDASVQEIFSTLLSGCKLEIITEQDRRDPQKILRLLKNKHLLITPTLFGTLMSYAEENDLLKELHSFEKLYLGGESIPQDMIKRYASMEGNKIEHLYNMYGPTEATVASTAYRFNRHDDQILIGRPIANAQVYIMNEDALCGIGEVGELCIAGDGLARGYLNQPELTAAKFVANPYGKGKLYRTGDLAKWTPDGNIICLGREDEQVSIRGFRIELKEIEQVMRERVGIKDCAVIAKEVKHHEKMLCGYLIAEGPLNFLQIKDDLAKKLPAYMIPSQMMQIQSLPLTRNGKLDKQALSALNITTTAEYVAPKNKKEKRLCDIFKTLLGLEKVSIKDNFFTLGGDSLKAMQVVSKISAANDLSHANEQIHFSVQQLFDYPTVETLLQFIEQERDETIQYDADDFKTINKLLAKNKITENTAPKQSLGHVLITGVTGWLGAHVLDAFLASEEGIAYCVVRGVDLAESQKRMTEMLTNYFGNPYTGSDRIVVICGDISEEIVVDEHIDTIINCAANVKHYGSYTDFYQINVLGTQNMIALAKQKKAKLIHISTRAIFGDGAGSDSTHTLDEGQLYVGQSLENVYIRSKFESEVAVLRAKLEGLEATVMRVGNLTNRFSDLKFQKNYQDNAGLKRLKAFANLGVFPAEWGPLLTYEFSPVDLTAQAVIKLAQHDHPDFSVFHVYHHREIPFSQLTQLFKLAPVTLEAFINEVKLTANQLDQAHIYEAFIDLIHEQDQHFSQSTNALSSDFSMWYLNQIGFDWPKIDARYVKEYVSYFEKIGCWKLPA